MSRLKDPDRRRVVQSSLAGLVAQFVAPDVLAQDAAVIEPGSFRVAFENDSLRALEFVSRPRTTVCGVGKHSHPAHLTVALSDARVRITLADGRQIEATNRLGDVFWSEAETHTVENIGGGTIRALIIELKSEPTERA